MAAIVEPPFVFDAIDEASAELILQLQLNDIEEFKESRSGKQKAGDRDDSELAATLLAENLEATRTLLFDRRMTKSIADAVQSDGPLLARESVEEEVACEDHALAHRLNGSEVTSEVHLGSESIDDSTLSKLIGRYVSEDLGRALDKGIELHHSSDEDEIAPESSAWASHRKTHGDAGTLNRQCEACRESKKCFDLVAAPCRHEYCRNCVRDLFNASLTDESLFPPKCCRLQIPVTTVTIFLTNKLRQKFEEKKVEFGTPNRTYCSRPTCSVFIKIENISDEIAVCPDCLTRTCTICKAGAHAGAECPNDVNLQATLDLAQANGWQRCHACRRMVELDIGCNHMTCRCGAQFCYECAVPWKGCTCAQWQDNRLLARANQVVQRDAPRMAPDDPLRARRVEQATEMLQERHDCTHRSWRYVAGSHQCEECYHQLPSYIFECRQCRIQACNRCRRNRL